jgi:hypothetical protein
MFLGQEFVRREEKTAAASGAKAESPTPCPSIGFGVLHRRPPRRSAGGALSIIMIIDNGFIT